MRALVREYVETAFLEGFRDGGGTPDQLGEKQQAVIDEFDAGQQDFIRGFGDAVRSAAKNPEERPAVLNRIEMWASSINLAGQRGWVAAQEVVKKRLQFHTAADDMVCVWCAPLNDRIVNAGEAFGDGPFGAVYAAPVHGHTCRCTVTEYLE